MRSSSCNQVCQQDLTKTGNQQMIHEIIHSPQLRYYYRNQDKVKEYKKKNKEKIRRNNIIYYHDHRKDILIKQAHYRLMRKIEQRSGNAEEQKSLRQLLGVKRF